jgi:hypothetical protein
VSLTGGWRGAVLGAVLAGGLVLTGCSSPSPHASSAGTTTTSKTTTSVAPNPATTSSTSPIAPRNLVANAAVKSALTAAYVAHSGLPADQVGGTAPGSVYYAYVPSTGTYWAIANFVPSSTASMQTKVSMQDDGCCGVFTQSSAAASWTFVSGYLGLPCPGEVPVDVMSVWNLQTGSDCAGSTPTTT